MQVMQAPECRSIVLCVSWDTWWATRRYWSKWAFGHPMGLFCLFSGFSVPTLLVHMQVLHGARYSHYLVSWNYRMCCGYSVEKMAWNESYRWATVGKKSKILQSYWPIWPGPILAKMITFCAQSGKSVWVELLWTLYLFLIFSIFLNWWKYGGG